MAGNIFQGSMVAHCQAGLAKAQALDVENHNGLKGQLREIIVGDLLLPVLPPEVRIGTGKLVSAFGEQSPQLDIILYAPGILPPFLFDQKSGYFPAESALYVIEVKSKLTSSSLREAISNARGTKSLPLLGTNHWISNLAEEDCVSSTPTGTPRAINALFALDSDLKGPSSDEIRRYFSLDENGRTTPALQALCIIGRGYWYLGKDSWRHIPSQGGIDEMMNFLAGMTNTMPKLLASKGRPNFGMYLTTEGSEPVDVPDDAAQ